MMELLESTAFCRGCSPEQLRAIAGICQPVRFARGASIFQAETPAEQLYVVSDGAVELRFQVTHYSAAREITLDRKRRGDAFGWSALVEPNVYHLTAVAARDSELLTLKAIDLNRLCSEDPRLGLTVMRNIAELVAERFEVLQKMLIDVVQQSLAQREP